MIVEFTKFYFSFWQQLANSILLICTAIMGTSTFLAGERLQRSAFQETKRSLRDKLTIEQQSKEQVHQKPKVA